MNQRKPLTHARQADTAKPEARPYTLKAGDGLFLKVMPNGTKKWVWRYFYLKKAKSLSMGLYPAVGLAEAKAARDEARKLLAQGEDPSQRRKDEKASALLEQENTFKAVAEEWQARQTDKAEATRTKSAWLLSFPIADFGHRPIRDITPVMVLNTCRKFENQDKLETAKRIKIKCSQVFRYAVATGRAESDPTRDLNGALKPPQVKHRAAITNPTEMAQLLRDIDGYSGHPQVQAALQISPLVFVRPGELRSARWADVDLEAAEWRFTPPKTRNQTQVELIVPLASQAVAILRNLHRITGRREHVFHSYGKSRHLSESAVLNALRRLGYSGDVMTGHGFRAMAKTVMLEVLKLPDQYIELQLGHKIRDPNGGAYHRAKFLEDRKEMMQVWADYLDKLRAGASTQP
ncbi:MAG: integrase [Haliea sp.]|nr:integrase [Haliea sp.]